MNYEDLKGLKVIIKSRDGFEDDCIGEITIPPTDSDNKMQILISGDLKKYEFPKCFGRGMRFDVDAKVPRDIQDEIIKYRHHCSWENILAEYLNGKSKLNYTDEIKLLDRDLENIGKYDYIHRRYNETVKLIYNKFIENASACDDDQELKDALNDGIREFAHSVVVESKGLLLDEIVKPENFINNTGKYQLPDYIKEYIFDSDNFEILNTITQSKNKALSDIKKEYFEKEYTHNACNEILLKLCEIRDEIKDKYLHKAMVKKYYPLLLEKINYNANNFPEGHPNGFEGLVHMTQVKNLINIFKDGAIKGRDALDNEEIEYIDAAMPEAMDNTPDWVKKCARFYYGFNTPTYYKAKYREPVGLVIDSEIMTWDNAIFLPYSAAAGEPLPKLSMQEVINNPWHLILHRGKYDRRFTSYYNKARNTDFLIDGEVSISMIKKIYFPNELIAKKVNDAIGDDLKGVEQIIDHSRFDNEWNEFNNLY